ncbi:MAG: hypothetical protein GDA48_26050 [Hormoscilla sp. GM102CHS1]|nr:hypothetical protein [Hormoscilla sp. GM102CHS1]
MTLKPGADLSEELDKMTQAMIPDSIVETNPSCPETPALTRCRAVSWAGALGHDRGNDSSPSQSNSRDISKPLVVDLRPFLSQEDLLAGEANR